MLRTFSIIGLALLSACVTTAKITLTWVADDIHEKDLSGVLVVTVSEKPEPQQRFERRFTAAFKKRGVHAVASYELQGGAKINKQDIIAMGQQAQLAAVRVTTFAGKDQHEVLHPGRTYYGMQPRWLSWRLQAYMYRKFLDGTNTPVS